MPWEPGTLLGLQDTTQPFGKYPGGSLFVMLERSEVFPGSAIVLTPRGTLALIPRGYLVPMRNPTPVTLEPLPPGGGG